MKRCPALITLLTPEAIRYSRALNRRNCLTDVPFDDTDQEAIIGLIEALDNYDPAKADHIGGWIYVTYYIRLYVRRYCWGENAGPAYVPRNIRHKTRTYSEFTLPGDSIENMTAINSSADAKLFRHDKFIEGFANQSDRLMDAETIWRVARRVLTKRQWSVMLARYMQGQTLEEIGAQLGRSRERIRQIEEDSIYRIKRALRRRATQC